MALAGIHHLLLQSLGWCLRNRRLLLWVFGVCYDIGWACMSLFAWVGAFGLVGVVSWASCSVLARDRLGGNKVMANGRRLLGLEPMVC